MVVPNQGSAGPSVARLVVSVADIERSLAFYRDLLGLTKVHQVPGFARLRTEDGPEVLLHERPAQPSDLAVAIGFTVDELERLVTAWERLAGVVVDPPTWQPWGETMAVVRDPDGHLVCLSQRARTLRPAG